LGLLKNLLSQKNVGLYASFRKKSKLSENASQNENVGFQSLKFEIGSSFCKRKITISVLKMSA
jgi:hypothetical protein